jgi:hypothetical protein
MIATMPPTANAVEFRRGGGPCPGIGIQWATGQGGGAGGGTEAYPHPLLWAAAEEYIWPASGGAAPGIGCWYAGAGCGDPAGALGWGEWRSSEAAASGSSAAPH